MPKGVGTAVVPPIGLRLLDVVATASEAEVAGLVMSP